MNILVLLFCFLLSAVWHQALYLVIPFVSFFFISSKKGSLLPLNNSILKLYFALVIAVVFFLIVQSFIDFEIKIFSIKGLGRYISYFLFAILVYYFSINDIVGTFKTIIGYFVFTFPLGVYQLIELGRYQNIFSHANHLAYVLTFCIYFLIFHKPFDKWIRTICVIVLLVSLLLTKSSGGMMVFLFLLAYNVFMSKRISFKKKLGLLISCVIITFLVLFYSEKISQQIETFEYLDWDFIKDRVVNFRAGGYGSLMWRIIYWLRILFSFSLESLSNIMFGIGVDSLTTGNMPYPYMKKDPHNDFVKVLVEFGIIGLLLFIIFLKRIYNIVYKNINIIILLVIPLFFGNAIVNFSFNLIFILLIFYEYKQYNTKSD